MIATFMKGASGERPTHMALVFVILLMCGQDPLVAVTHEGSDWSKARKIRMMEVNMLGAQVDAAANRCRRKLRE